MDVTAKYELIGLMAYPIRHSLSPEMQNKALEKAGLPFKSPQNARNWCINAEQTTGV